MIFTIFITFCVSSTVLGYAPLREPGAGMYNDVSFIQDVLERMNRDLDVGSGNAFADLGNRMDEMSPLSPMRESAFGRTAKDAEMMDVDGLDYEMLLNGAANPSIRDTEYLQHSSLWGHKYMSGGASEGSQKLKGGQQAPTEIKTDAILPAYCNPPNPCPVGYTAEDGCIETFENTAAFSRAYQASQDCMCDTEHMFECPAPRDSDVDLSGTDFLNDLQQQLPGEHKSLVAKKFYNKKSSHDEELARLNQLARHAAMVGSMKPEENPFLMGEKLPIAAKKGHHAQHNSEPQLNL